MDYKHAMLYRPAEPEWAQEGNFRPIDEGDSPSPEARFVSHEGDPWPAPRFAPED